MTLLSLDNPANGTLADATLIANNNDALETLINGQLDSGNLAINAVGTSELQDLSVTTPKIADLAVTTAKIADGAVTPAKLSAALSAGISGTVSGTPPASPTAGTIWFLPFGGLLWQFSYQPSLNATYPWFFVGGPPYLQEIHTTVNYSATAGGWVTDGSFCPVAAMPRAGSYLVDGKTTFHGATSAVCELAVGSGSFVPAFDGSDDLDSIQASGAGQGTVAAGKRNVVVAATQTLTLAYRVGGAGPQFNHTAMTITPNWVQ